MQESEHRAHLACRAVGDISTLPQPVHTDLLELGRRGVGVQAFPRVKDHLAGGQQV